MNETKIETYEDLLETAANTKSEIKNVHRKMMDNLRKIYELAFDDKSTNFNFVKDVFYAEKKQKPSKIKTFREQLAALVKIYTFLGLGDNLKAFFREAGIEISYVDEENAENEVINLENETKLEKLWDEVFFTESLPVRKSEMIKQLLDNGNVVQEDIEFLSEQVKSFDELSERSFDISKKAFSKAVDLRVDEKEGKSIQEKLQKIEDEENSLKEALKPFFETVDETELDDE